MKKIEARAPLVLLDELRTELASAGFTQPLTVMPLLGSAELFPEPSGTDGAVESDPGAECKLEFVVSDRQATKLATIVAGLIKRHETGHTGHLIVLSVQENYEFGHESQ